MTKFSFGTVHTDGGDRTTVLVDGAHYLLNDLVADMPAAGLRTAFCDWDALVERTAQRLRTPVDPARAVREAQLLAPIRYPNKLVCVGAVYSDHLQQFDLPAVRWPRMPIFLRPPTTSIVGPGATVHIPATTQQFDWEIELAVVVGRTLYDADENAARAAIAGYSTGIDFTCRDLLDRGSAVGVDLIRAKAQDCMAPVGPTVVPARFIPDPQRLSLRLWVNGELRQDGTTANMLFSVSEQLAIISRFITLEPGDIVFTGSPAGSARSDDQFLKSGDRIRAEIEGVPPLELQLLAPRGK